MTNFVNLTAEEILRTIKNYDQLIAQAADIAKLQPFNRFLDEDFDYLKLEINDDVVKLYWPSAYSDYDGDHGIEKDSIIFPSKLLRFDKEQLEQWSTEETERRRKADEERRAQLISDRAAALEESEREQLAWLKAKYEGRQR